MVTVGCGCHEVHYASLEPCGDHEARRAAAWADIDGRLADRFLDVMLLAKHLNAAPGAVHRFVKVRRALLALYAVPTLPDDRLAMLDQLLELDRVHAVLYERVAGRITYELAAGFEVSKLGRVEADCQPEYDLYPQIPWAGQAYCCEGWFQ